MEFCISNASVQQLEAAMAATDEQQRLPLLTALAWHYRQRHSVRAGELVAQATALLAEMPAQAPERLRAETRLALVRGEQAWLGGQIDAAEASMRQALEQSQQDDDALACADAYWILAALATDRGMPAQRDAHLEQVRAHAARAGDPIRLQLARIAAMRTRVFTQVKTIEAEFHATVDIAAANTNPVLATWANDLLGVAASNLSNFTLGIERQLRAYEAALDSGQMHRALFAMMNLGVSFNNLGDHRSALEWLEKGIHLARQAGWPACAGMALMQSAEPLRLLGRRDAARAMLNEALELLAPYDKTHNYGTALLYLSELQVDTGDHAAALQTIRKIEARHTAQSWAGQVQMAQRSKALALCHLGRVDEALEVAGTALSFARAHDDAYNVMAALQVLADIHAMHRLPVPPEATAASGTLHYLEQVLAVGKTITGNTSPSDLLEKLGRAYADAGDTARAYDYLLQACEVRQQAHSQEAANRATAMQVWHETERTRLESEYHRHLAEAQASRAEVLQSTTNMLVALGAIGQEITAQLSAAAILEAIQRHVHSLLDAIYLSIYMMDDAGEGLQPVLAMENGQQVTARYVSLAHPHSGAARCVRENRAIIVNVDPTQPDLNHLPGTLPTRSLMFTPLSVSDRILGVMSIQSLARHAYSEREQSIFQTLSAYGAIALDNARAYQELTRTQEALLQKNAELEQTYAKIAEQNITDPLTGLRNRRFLTSQMEQDAALTLRRYDEYLAHDGPPPLEHDLAFFMIDLDHFKEVNDTHGHAAGDAILMQLRTRLEAVFRESDYVVRWGGEEFLAVARGTNRDDVLALAERVRAMVSSAPFEIAPGEFLQRTCSIGFACFPFVAAAPRWLNWVQVCELADRALYMAKRGGRDRSCGLAPGPTPPLSVPFPGLVNALPRHLENGQLQLIAARATVG